MNAEVVSEILERGKDDWVDFAAVLSIVRARTGRAEPAMISLSVELLGDMLNQHLVMVGDLLKRGDITLFSPWDGPPQQIIERIKKGLTDLGHRPGIGDICWLSTL